MYYNVTSKGIQMILWSSKFRNTRIVANKTEKYREHKNKA